MKQPTVLVRALVLAAAPLLLAPGGVHGDVVFDGTLGAGGAAPTRPLDGRTDFVIDQSRGVRVESGGRANLFHSFTTFDLATDQSASFRATDPVDTILARVTGGSTSTIAGRLRSEVAGADLFLINPAGITLTETATLDLPASFFATSADFVQLDDGSSFSSTAPVPTVTAAAPSAFGFLGGSAAGAITVEGERAITLAAASTFGLVGGDVGVRDGSRVFVAGGRVDLAAVGSAAVVVPIDIAGWSPRADQTAGLGSVTVDGFEATLDALDLVDLDANQGRIVIRGGALRVETSFLRAGGDGGADAAIDLETTGTIEIVNSGVQVFGAGSADVSGIRASSSRIDVSQSTVSGIASRTLGTGAAGDVVISADELHLNSGGQIQSDADGAGDGASIVIDALEVTLDGGATIQTDSTGSGRSGSVTITADRISGSNLSEISSRTDGLGAVGNDAGPITITSDTLELRTGARISGTTDGSGRGADITLDVADSILLDGELVLPGGQVLPSGIYARSGIAAGSPATGDGGTVTITSGEMTISNGAQIAASPRGTGAAGGISISVDDTFTIRGEGGLNAGIFAEGVEGDGGPITVSAGSIQLLDGARVESAALATGQAGDITLDAIDITLDGDVQVNARSEGAGHAGDVTFVGDSIVLRRGARVQSLTEETGEAGDVQLVGGTVRLDSGSSVNARAFGVADAGHVTISGDSVRVTDGAEVLTISSQSVGGNVTFDVAGTLQIDSGALIATDVRGTTGQGGDVVIESESTVVNAADVTANAFAANAQAGNIYIEVRGGYFESTDATVEATNDFGVDGLKVVNTPINEVVGDLVPLESDFVDASDRLEAACIARGSASGSLSVQRGRAPPPPPDQSLDPSRPPELHVEQGDVGVGRCEGAR